MPEAGRSTTTETGAGASLAGSREPLLDNNVLNDLDDCINALRALQFMLCPILEQEGIHDDIVLGIRNLFDGPIDGLRDHVLSLRDMASFVPEPPREVRAVDPYADPRGNRPVWKIAPEAVTAARMLADAGEERAPVPVSLYPTVSSALDKASVRRAMSPGALAGFILTEWLHANGLLDIPAVDDAEVVPDHGEKTSRFWSLPADTSAALQAMKEADGRSATTMTFQMMPSLKSAFMRACSEEVRSKGNLFTCIATDWLVRQGYIEAPVDDVSAEQPTGRPARDLRNDFIRERMADGIDAATIAQALNLKRVTVERVIGKLLGDPPPQE